MMYFLKNSELQIGTFSDYMGIFVTKLITGNSLVILKTKIFFEINTYSETSISADSISANSI